MRNFFKKETEVDKINAEIKNTEFKKKAIVSGIISEKSEINAKIKALYCQIGEISYKNFTADVKDYDFSSVYAEIKALEEEYDLKNKKQIEMENRYDEEISMLKSTINIAMANSGVSVVADTTPANSAPCFCEQCGSAINEGDLFCEKCGAKV